jgi:poly-gamma-glutamate capsule biosynthesis protein CapA/YwtB (metallophosphatase superfamily)
MLLAGAAATVPRDRNSAMANSADDAASSSDRMTFFLVGDVMLGRGIDQILPHPGDPQLFEPQVASATTYVELAEAANGPIPRPVDFSYVWGDARTEIDAARPDLRIVNLETSVTKSAQPLPKGINYKMSPDNVGCLTAMRIDCCVLANNHVLDWGRPGLLETLATLQQAGIASAGAGRTLREAAAPATLPMRGGARVLVFGFGAGSSGVPADWAAGKDTPGVNFLEDLSDGEIARVANAVARAKRPGDLAIASIHWGGNWGYHVAAAQRRFAHGLIDNAGVDIVYGHSSHHPKGIEVYRQKLILYGCGDFLNDYEGIKGYEEFRDDLAVAYVATCSPSSGALLDLTLLPFQIRKFRLNRVSAPDLAWLQTVLDRESTKLGTRIARAEGNILRADWR